jgi:NitT/TauT family transport system substrate-binding protein
VKSIFAAVLLWHLVAVCPSAAQTIKLKVAYPTTVGSMAVVWVAKEAKLFEKHGLEVELIYVAGSSRVVQAMLAKDIPISEIAIPAVIQANLAGADLVMLAGPNHKPGQKIMVKPEIKRREDLKGKKIGTAPPGHTPDQLTRVALRRLGIDPEKDVTLVPFDEDRNVERMKSLLTGQVSGMMVTANTLYDLEKTGQIDRFNKLTDNKQLKIYAGGGADYAVATSFLQNRRDDVKKFMAGICEGIAVARKDKAKALAFVAKSGRDLEVRSAASGRCSSRSGRARATLRST